MAAVARCLRLSSVSWTLGVVSDGLAEHMLVSVPCGPSRWGPGGLRMRCHGGLVDLEWCRDGCEVEKWSRRSGALSDCLGCEEVSGWSGGGVNFCHAWTAHVEFISCQSPVSMVLLVSAFQPFSLNVFLRSNLSFHMTLPYLVQIYLEPNDFKRISPNGFIACDVIVSGTTCPRHFGYCLHCKGFSPCLGKESHQASQKEN